MDFFKINSRVVTTTEEIDHHGTVTNRVHNGSVWVYQVNWDDDYNATWIAHFALRKENMFPWTKGDKVLLSNPDRNSKDVVTFEGLNDHDLPMIRDHHGRVYAVTMDRLSFYHPPVANTAKEYAAAEARMEIKQPKFTHRSDLLEKAEEIITKDRNNSYGEPDQDFKRIAELWSTFLGTKIEPHQVAVCMILLKASRLSWNETHEDSWLDIAGYAACGFETMKLNSHER